MIGQQLDILAAIDRANARRDLGIERVVAKAERVNEGWQASALEHLTAFVKQRRELAAQTREECALEFLAEEFVRYASIQGLPEPHDSRAFGSVMQTAARRGLITKVGYRLALSSNMSPKCLWKGTAS